MKFGCCTDINGIGVVEAAGYDYVELPMVALLGEKPDSEFAPIGDAIAAHSIKPEAWNILLPGDMKVTGPEVDIYRINRYLHTSFERVSGLGGQIVVFGSGNARNIPNGFPIEEAHIQLAEFLDVAADAANRYGLKIAIEPLNRKESNIINSVAEALELAIAVGRPEVRVLADLYHIDEEREPLSHVADAALWLLHAHTADTGRYRPGSGSYDNLGFIRTLLNMGYDGRMSVECKWNDFASEAPLALEFLRETESKARG